MTTAQHLGFLCTPPLWEKEQFGVSQFEFPNLNMEQFQPQPIPSGLRLGHQMEYVFKQLVEHSGGYDIALYNLPVREGQRTLGEIDFLLKNKISNQLIHVELTYKFYIIDPAFADPIHQLIGPNRRDTFFEKKEKIKNKQFPLLHSKGGIQALANKGIDHQLIEHQCCFKAQLFKPFGEWDNRLGVFNEQCLRGYWLRFEDFKQAASVDAQYYLPSKSEWVVEPHRQVGWKSLKEMLADVAKNLDMGKAPMIWMWKPDDKLEQFFVLK